MDHGVDSFVIGFMILMSAKILVINDPILNFIYITSCQSQFYFATLEEFYVGGLHLGPGNGVTDASLMVYVVFGVMFSFGP